MSERRKRGVPLNDLDRDLAWVIAHNGRRWEVVGPAEGPSRAVGGPEGALRAPATESRAPGGPQGLHAAAGASEGPTRPQTA